MAAAPNPTRNSPPRQDIRDFLEALRRPAPTAPAGVGAGTLSLSVHRASGQVNVIGSGFWSEALVQAHFHDLKLAADTLHADGTPARVLVDLRDAAVQTNDSAERIRAATRRTWHGRDRVAVVIRSSLASLQISRVIDENHHRLFADMDDARAWLRQV